jgi:hypothetical protein
MGYHARVAMRSLLGPRSPLPLLTALGLGSAVLGCGGDLVRFPLRDPVWADADKTPWQHPCRSKPEPDDPNHKECAPEEYESPFAWDAADNTVFRPLAKLFAFDPGGESVNVNAVDEVPDSSWFTNRLGKAPMTVQEVENGSCGKKVLDPSAADGTWLIDLGKPNGANPGFRIKVEGIDKFMLKADPANQPERSTGATSIASRLYHAAGWYAPCDSVIYFRPSLLKLKPGLEVTDNTGVTKPFDQKALDELLAKASKRDGLVRMVASRWLPGRAIGPFKYEGTRDDDPNDVIPHEDRRDLRGARVIAAWLNHFDSREQNTMNLWMAQNPKDKDSSPGHIQHWYIDLGDCFGSEWEWEGISKRLGHAYYLDLGYVTEDLLTFGIIERPWDRAQRSPDGKIFGFFHSRDFEPHEWKGGYPNPAFARMTELDGAWAARTIARFTPEHVEAAVRVGDYTAPEHSAFLIRHLLLRQEAILKRYFKHLSPVTDLAVHGAELCGADLARRSGKFPAGEFRYAATVYSGTELTARSRPAVRAAADGGVCVSLSHVADDGGPRPDAPERYVVVDITNGQAKGALRAHLYDLGPRGGFRLVGIERPDDASPPG